MADTSGNRAPARAFRGDLLVVPVVCAGVGVLALGVVGPGSGSAAQPQLLLLAVWVIWPLVGAVLLDANSGSRLARVLIGLGLMPAAAVGLSALSAGGRPSVAASAVALAALGGVAAVGTLIAAPLGVVNRAAAVGGWITGLALAGAGGVAVGWTAPGWVAIGVAIVVTVARIRSAGIDSHHRRQGFWTVGLVVVGSVTVTGVLSVGSGQAMDTVGALGLAVMLAVAPVAFAVLVLRSELGPPGAPMLDAALTAAGVLGVLVAFGGGLASFTRLGLPAPGAAAAVVACLVAAAAVPVIVTTRSRLLVSWYGLARVPSRALGELTERIRDTDDPRELLGAAAAAAATAVHSPGSSITLGADEPDTEPDDVVVPLRVCGQRVGSLLVNPHGPGRPLERRDLDVLATLSVPIALVTQAVGVAVDREHARRDAEHSRLVERERILADLHDGLGPMLAGLGMGLAGVQRSTPDADPASRAALAGLSDGLADARTELRRIVTGLAPSHLTRTDLADSLTSLVGQLQVGGHPDTPSIALHVDLPRPLDTGIAVTAYRTVAEALANVLRHARATTCEVGVRTTGDAHLEISVTDNGVGIPTAPLPTGGIGLASLRRRAESLGGWMDLTPRAGGGTSLVVMLPTREPR